MANGIDLAKLTMNNAIAKMVEHIGPADADRYRYAKTVLTAVVQNTSDDEARQACVIALRVLSASEQVIPSGIVQLEQEPLDSNLVQPSQGNASSS